jgi:hypothetical protein
MPKHRLSFGLATVLTAPFALILVVVVLLALFPGLRASRSLGDLILLAYYAIPSPVGLTALALAIGSVCLALRSRTSSSVAWYASLAYAAVLLCHVAYVAWWYGTGQQWDSL